MDEVNDFSRVQRDTTSLSCSGSDPGAHPYGIMVPEFSRHAGEPGTAYNDDCQGPFHNTTAEGSAPTCSPDLHAPNDLETILQDETPRPHSIPLQALEEITDNFSDERILGQGGSGVVYKGVLRNGEMIAVKRTVSSIMPGLQKKFEAEVYHLMMLKHPNIIRCVGYCYETKNECLEYNGKYVFAQTEERLLCLEYMPKGSLYEYLSDESFGLDWSTRYNIIKGICYGLCHLHEERDKPIIHMNLKPSNILLDYGMLPKITGFRLSRLLDQEQTICTSSREGTLGYMAPEFLHGGKITRKCDIFSLGVIIMEVVTGHKHYLDVTRTPSDDFIELALDKWRNVLQRSPGYGSLETDCEQIKRCIQVGRICTNPDRTKRPPIAKIINMLQGSESIDGVTAAKPTRQSVDTLRVSTLYRKATELVGTDEKSLQVIKMLMEGDEVFKKQLKVVSIVGFGGLGKTTLANAVYEKLKVQFDSEKKNFQFECTAFVCVSLDPNMEKIFKSLLHQLDKQKYENINKAAWGEVQLIGEMKTFLADKRYLVVIDDIWDKCVWENIKYAFIENEHGSKVITTTRILDVAQQADSVYRLEPLSVVDSRKLFYQRIYKTENKSPPNKLVEVSENILKRCGGVPLAIITIGSLLSSKKGRSHTYESWSKVYESMGSVLDNSHHDVKNMRRILSVGYSDLPAHLKTCLRHLSLYQEDYEIETEQLILKWVGEGFVEEEQGRSLYEVGEGYFGELINKSLVQPLQFDNVNKVCSCCVHDMVRDLITSLSNEENFLTTVDGQQPLHLPSKISQLSVQTNIEEVANQLLTASLSHERICSMQNATLDLINGEASSTIDMASPSDLDGAGLQASSSSSRDIMTSCKLQNTTSLTMRELQEITNNFCKGRAIGEGAYGKVFRGTLDNGEEIAVKLLHNKVDTDDGPFRREFENIMTLEHRNIVRLVGYCYETQHKPMIYMGQTIFAEEISKALCFEYMQNGSLEKHLSEEFDGLDWHTRYKIIKGTCEGLQYLHEGLKEPIYHLDLKPDNILLDENMVPKLADFGLSRLFSGQKSMVTQNISGTIGYMHPEYLFGNIISNKFDVFSLGVAMTKIIAGPRGHTRSAEMSHQEFLDQVKENWRHRLCSTGSSRKQLEAHCQQVHICTEIALSCMEHNRHKRPVIIDIIHQLNETEATIDRIMMDNYSLL